MGVLLFELIGGESDRSFEKGEGSKELYEPACKATLPERKLRFQSMEDFCIEMEALCMATIEVKEEIRAQKPSAAREGAVRETERAVERETAGTPDSKKSRAKLSPKAENPSYEEADSISPLCETTPVKRSS